VVNILNSNSEYFNAVPKAKTAKIVRNIINIVATVPDSLKIQIQLCKDVIAWCKAEKRTFLRQRIEAKVSLTVFIIVIFSVRVFFFFDTE
jgi:26S proteasome regulatory subunit N6